MSRCAARILPMFPSLLALLGCAGDPAPAAAADLPQEQVGTEEDDDERPPAGVEVRGGLDVLADEGCARLEGRRVGLITNHSALTRDGRHAIDVLRQAEGVDLVALFVPEHGLHGLLDKAVPSGTDRDTGLAIHSLYGDTRRPTPEMLLGLDTLVFDVQDVGARFYTYISTLGLCLEEAALNKLRVVVLDRPNPLGGVQVDGPLPDADLVGRFTCYEALPVVHGMTIGEVARLIVSRKGLDVDLEVVALDGWRRGTFQDETGLPWVNPSPNLRSLQEALLYPMVALVEGNKALSVGRGTDRPFEYVGAPWIQAGVLTSALRERRVPGLWVAPITFVPSAVDVSGRANARYPHTGKVCQGVRLVVTDRRAFRPVEAGAHLLQVLHELYPEQTKLSSLRGLIGAQWVLEALAEGRAPAEVAAEWRARPEFIRFRAERQAALLYD